MSLDPRRPVSELPIAQRQLVAICRAIGSDARLIIMDEPTASLTKVEVAALLGLARQLSQKEITILFVSHKLNEVLDVAERVTILRDGRKIGVFEAREMTDRRLATLITGKEFDYSAQSLAPANAPPVLSVRGLTRRSEFTDVSLDVHVGEIVGLTGLLGAGRTELALALFGLSRAESGEVLVEGVPLPAGRNSAAIARGVAYIPEDRIQFGLVMEQPTATNLVLTILDKLIGRFGILARQKLRDAAARSIGELDIKVGDPERPVKTLSGGNQQRVVLAKWLATAPRVLILDNPTVGVDVRAKDGISAIIRQMAASGKAIIFISDEILEVLNHAHRILIMREGRITASLLPAETTESDFVPWRI